MLIISESPNRDTKHAVTMKVILFIGVFDFPKKIVIRIKQDYNLVLWLYFQDGRQVGRVEVFFLYNVINEVISFCIWLQVLISRQ